MQGTRERSKTVGKAKEGGSSEGEKKRMRVMQVMQAINSVLATYLDAD